MLMTRTLIGLCLVGSACGALANTQSDAVERGQYLAIAGDCAGCHTRDGGDDYAGGLPIDSPLGTMYTANITPDEETGIGSWTEENFRKVLRLGRGHDDEYIYPAMPYTAYTKITDGDISDLWAFVQSLPPVNYVPPDNTMVFPANIRQGMAVWQAIEFTPGAYEPDTSEDAVYNRGAYLVEALAHCSACHSPRDIMLGEKQDERYTGAEIHGWYAPDISSGPLSVLADWSIEELSAYLSTGSNDTNQKVFGEMATVIHASTSKLTTEDVTAIATYLKNMPPAAGGEQGVAVSDSQNEVRLHAGRALYAEQCMGCHQADGKGIEAGAPSLVSNGAVTNGPANNLIILMLEGHAPEQTWGVMPSFANILSAQDLADVANYVRTAWGNQGAADATVDLVHELRDAAQLPAGGQQAAVNCPVLSGALMAPTLDMTVDEFNNALDNESNAQELVGRYRDGQASTEDIGQTVQALSSAYCRALASQNDMSGAEQQARVAALAGRVSVAAMR